MAEVSEAILEEPAHLEAIWGEAEASVSEALAGAGSDTVRRFGEYWYRAGVIRGVAAAVAALESR